MKIPDKFEKALFREFAANYQLSELPDSWSKWLEESLQTESAASASRLCLWIKESEKPELASFLRSASSERRGELVKKLESWTRVRWRDERSNWPALKQILNAIADHLDHEDKK